MRRNKNKKLAVIFKVNFFQNKRNIGYETFDIVGNPNIHFGFYGMEYTREWESGLSDKIKLILALWKSQEQS